MTDGDSKTFHVGPAEVPYWKFWLAGIVWKLTRGNPLPYVYLVPGAKRAAMWAFEVRVLSRDFEEVADSTTDQ
jgi:hypothetical protein